MFFSIGVVSGIIAAVVFLIQQFIPIALPFLALCVLREQDDTITENAVTWSVVGRVLHSSYWPTLLRSDTVATNGVTLPVQVISTTLPILTVLVAIAAIVTPLGLYEEIAASSSKSLHKFTYIKDTSAFGFSSPVRSQYGLNRNCWPLVCPLTNPSPFNTSYPSDNLSMTFQSTYDISIPESLIQVFKYGNTGEGKSVSSIFDIHWRSAQIERDGMVNWDKPYLVGSSSFGKDIVAQDEDYVLIDGLVVDIKSGKIGFRNHTLPAPSDYGLTWTERLLFVEPRTECVDTNLSIEYTIAEPNDYNMNMENISLVAERGITGISPEIPTKEFPNPQSDPALFDRAHRAALLNNFFTMQWMNISNVSSSLSSVLEFGILPSPTSYMFQPNTIQTSTYGSYFSSQDYGPDYAEEDMLKAIDRTCSTTTRDNVRDTNSVYIRCGLLFGASISLDGRDPFDTAFKSRWKIPLYSCSSATRASLKDVTFTLNSSASLSAVRITGMEDPKISDSSAQPLWGVENVDFNKSQLFPPDWYLMAGTSKDDQGSSKALESTSYSFPPFWGLVNGEPRGMNISTLRSDALWLPGDLNYTVRNFGSFRQNLAGVEFHTYSLEGAYNIALVQGGYDKSMYSGLAQPAIYAKWYSLSRVATSAAQIINLIWIDIAANAVVGTRGWLTPENATPNFDVSGNSTQRRPEPLYSAQVPVTLYEKRIRYHIVYAIPAMIVGVFIIIATIATTIFSVRGRVKIAKMRRYLNATSPGRLITSFLYQDSPYSPLLMASASVWISAMGSRDVILGTEQPLKVFVLTDEHSDNGTEESIAGKPAARISSERPHFCLVRSKTI